MSLQAPRLQIFRIGDQPATPTQSGPQSRRPGPIRGILRPGKNLNSNPRAVHRSDTFQRQAQDSHFVINHCAQDNHPGRCGCASPGLMELLPGKRGSGVPLISFPRRLSKVSDGSSSRRASCRLIQLRCLPLTALGCATSNIHLISTEVSRVTSQQTQNRQCLTKQALLPLPRSRTKVALLQCPGLVN